MATTSQRELAEEIMRRCGFKQPEIDELNDEVVCDCATSLVVGTLDGQK